MCNLSAGHGHRYAGMIDGPNRFNGFGKSTFNDVQLWPPGTNGICRRTGLGKLVGAVSNLWIWGNYLQLILPFISGLRVAQLNSGAYSHDLILINEDLWVSILQFQRINRNRIMTRSSGSLWYLDCRGMRRPNRGSNRRWSRGKF